VIKKAQHCPWCTTAKLTLRDAKTPDNSPVLLALFAREYSFQSPLYLITSDLTADFVAAKVYQHCQCGKKIDSDTALEQRCVLQSGSKTCPSNHMFNEQ
jgi:hypothetical protein